MKFFLLSIFLILFISLSVLSAGTELVGINKPGGEMTSKRISTRSFIFPGPNATKKQQLNFWTGFSLFRYSWVIAPSSTKDCDGLGPLFNARSCVACHTAGSRGEMSEAGESLPTSLVIRLGQSDVMRIKGSANVLDNPYGGQIQPRVIPFNHRKLSEKLKGEAWLALSYKAIDGSYSDGKKYQLQQPTYKLMRLSYGDLPLNIKPSPRFAPNIFGAGLLDAIDEKNLLKQEDISDSNKDGISAKYNRVTDLQNGREKIGRFGFKAKHPNLYQQVAAAFRDDIGITSQLFPEETCTKRQVLCTKAAVLGEHNAEEIPNKLLSLVVSFNRLLAVPPNRYQGSKKVAKGRTIFNNIGCAQCHTPSYTTDKSYPDKALANQTIWPYTNLALHDMGPLLADGVIEGKANGQEWRTPPLWGIGLQKEITKKPRFLHDGRAQSIEEAILWHGGESTTSQQRFKQLNKQNRQATLRFVNSI